MTQTRTPPAVLDRRLDAIAHRHRRALLHELLDRPADPESALDLGTVVERGDASMVELYHRHVPKLARCGLVRWDPDDRTLERGPAFGSVGPLLEHVETAPVQDVGH